MSTVNVCPECGAELGEDAPGGLCPKCLMANAMETSPNTPPNEFGGASRESGIDDSVVLGDVKAVDEQEGRYTMVSEYAKGGMGRVLLVHDDHLGRDIALKELLPGLVDDSTPGMAEHIKEMTARFLREAKITGQLEHPSITPVHELGRRDDGTLYYTMKLIRGKTLSQAIQDAGSYEARLKLLPHFVDLCNAIAYAHARGVIHRDIKPSNVMVGEFGETVVIDWGLAKVKGRAEKTETDPLAETILSMKAGKDDDSAKTRYGQAMGTPAYMPPEQATGDLDAIDERSDIYSLGAVLYEILTGQPPYTGESAQDIMRKVVTVDPRPVKELAAKANREILRICEQAISKDPERRIQSAREFGLRMERTSTRGAFINPFRPYLKDLVPELAELSPKKQELVSREANKRMRKNRELIARMVLQNGIFLVFSATVMAFFLLSIPVFSVPLEMDEIHSEVMRLKAIIYNSNMGENYPPSFYEDKRLSKPIYGLLQDWDDFPKYTFSVVALGMAVMLVGILLLSAYLVAQTRENLAPYLREAITELEAQGALREEPTENVLSPLYRGALVLYGLIAGAIGGAAVSWVIAPGDWEQMFEIMSWTAMASLFITAILVQAAANGWIAWGKKGTK